MRVLVTGGSGMLGKEIVKLFQNNELYDITAVFRNKNDNAYFPYIKTINADITVREGFAQILRQVKPDIIIHCAAVVNVDLCENEQKYVSELHSGIVNTIAQYAPFSKVIYISSDSVFDGIKGNYSEEESPLPINYYAKSKFEGEQNTSNLITNSIIIRTNIYGFHNNGKNSLAEWALNALKMNNYIEGFNDVYFNPVYTGQLALIINDLIGLKYKGIIHVGSEIYCSKYDFLVELAKAFEYNPELIQLKSVNVSNFTAPRPRNTTLSVDLLRKILYVPNLFEGIKWFKADYNNYYA